MTARGTRGEELDGDDGGSLCGGKTGRREEGEGRGAGSNIDEGWIQEEEVRAGSSGKKNEGRWSWMAGHKKVKKEEE